MRYTLVVLWMLAASITPARAQLTIGIGLPELRIGINLPVYPELVRVPGYPVYYAPQLDSNYFFYDGMYWVYLNDSWYASSWYNGPWGIVDSMDVPVYLLRTPVRYYRHPPAYFQGWQEDAPPRWGDHWGRDWQRQHSGWDHWNRASEPAPAPLPSYQRQYSSDRYPSAEQQRVLHGQNYRYQPHDPVVRQRYRASEAPKGATESQPRQPSQERRPPQDQQSQNQQRQQQDQQKRQKQEQQSQNQQHQQQDQQKRQQQEQQSQNQQHQQQEQQKRQQQEQQSQNPQHPQDQQKP